MNKYYCHKKYGFSSTGCIIRIGTTCKEMTPEQIKIRYEQMKGIISQYFSDVEHNFEDVSAVKDDNNRWHLYIKEKDQPYFIIQPEMRDMSRLFEAFKSQDQQAIYDTKTSLGEKYTKLDEK